MTQGAARYSHGEIRNRITHNLFCPSGEFLIEIQRPCLSQANWVEQPDGLAVAPSFEDSARSFLSDSRPSLSGRRKANEERPNQVPTMMILVTAMFLLVLVLIALCLLCVRRLHQSESVPVWLFYSVGLLCADHRDRDRHPTFLRRLRLPGKNPRCR